MQDEFQGPTYTPATYFTLLFKTLTQILGVPVDTATEMVIELRRSASIDGREHLKYVDPPLYIACDLAKVTEVTPEMDEAFNALEAQHL